MSYHILQCAEGTAIAYAGFAKTLKAVPINFLDRNQHWKVGPDAAHGEGNFVTSKIDNHVFDVSQNVAKENQPILAYTKKAVGQTKNQRFNLSFSEETQGHITTLLDASFVITGVNGQVVLAKVQSPPTDAQSFVFVPAPEEFSIKIINKRSKAVTVQFTNAPDLETEKSFSIDSNAEHTSNFVQGSILEITDESGKVKTVRVTQDETIQLDDAPVDLGEPGQFLIYNPVAGSARVVGFSSQGALTLNKVNPSWWKTFTLLAPGDYRGVKQTDVLLYAPANAGNGVVVDVAADGSVVVFPPFSSGVGKWWTTWKYMIAGNFRGRGAHDAFLHESQKTPAGIATIVSFSDKGVYNYVRNTLNFGLYNSFVAGRFLGTEQDQLIAYNTTSGVGFLVGFDATGIVNLKVALPAWAHKASHVVEGNFRGKDKPDLVLYDRSTGNARLISFAADGSAELVVEHSGWTAGWDLVAAGDLRGIGREDVVGYTKIGRGDLIGFADDGNSNSKTHSSGWHTGWTSMNVSGRYSKAKGRSQILLYDKATGAASMIIWNHNGVGLEVDTKQQWEAGSSHVVSL